MGCSAGSSDATLHCRVLAIIDKILNFNLYILSTCFGKLISSEIEREFKCLNPTTNKRLVGGEEIH